MGGVPLPLRGVPRIPVLALGTSLGLFLAISYMLCVLFYLWFPEMAAKHLVLVLFLPGFKLLTWPSFFLGLIESFGYGWYVALVFGPLYNFFATRWS
jgi:hypothetical protein